jgi:hypothetical protein
MPSLHLTQEFRAVSVRMETTNAQYEGGDVLIKPSWESPEFFLVHHKVLSERSSYFRALLADRWSKPRVLGSDETGTPVWNLYISTETKDPKNATYVLTTKVCLTQMLPHSG